MQSSSWKLGLVIMNYLNTLVRYECYLEYLHHLCSEKQHSVSSKASSCASPFPMLTVDNLKLDIIPIPGSLDTETQSMTHHHTCISCRGSNVGCHRANPRMEPFGGNLNQSGLGYVTRELTTQVHIITSYSSASSISCC